MLWVQVSLIFKPVCPLAQCVVTGYGSHKHAELKSALKWKIWSHLGEPRDGGSVIGLAYRCAYILFNQKAFYLNIYFADSENAHLHLIPTQSNLYLLHP